jgi:hypothetical protein
MPYIIFADSQSRARWTIFVPDDWIVGSDVHVNLHWSLKDADTGNVFWFLESKSLAAGESVSGANMTDTYVAAGNATAYVLMSTGQNLTIPGASMALGDLLQVAVGRSGGAGTDTNTKEAFLHHARVEYTALKPPP